MSGVYIRSADFLFPQDCNHCILCVQCTGERYRRCEITYRPIRGDMDKRQKWCPPIEVPDHGRLIDADEFLERAIGTHCFRGDYALMLVELVGESPTIIPADKEVQE